MTISGNVPNHLVIGARTGFLAAMEGAQAPWQQVAGTLDMGSQSLTIADIGGAPMPLEDVDGAIKQELVERALTVKARNWQITIPVSYNAIQDNQTSESFERKIRSAAENFNRHMNKLVFLALDDGAGSTYGLSYDGLSFFNDSHLNNGSTYDNNFALSLSLANFKTNLALARAFTDESGEAVDYMYDTLIVPPALEYEGAQITGNFEDYSTANRAVNPWSGRFKLIVTPHLDSTAWVVAATSHSIKPLYIAMRERPALQEAWFNPKGPDGGTYNFKFYSRYNVVYGDPRLAFLGNT
jgi:phage major head subunit gpT-like protein